jgi:hypothetical protein
VGASLDCGQRKQLLIVSVTVNNSFRVRIYCRKERFYGIYPNSRALQKDLHVLSLSPTRQVNINVLSPYQIFSHILPVRVFVGRTLENGECIITVECEFQDKSVVMEIGISASSVIFWQQVIEQNISTDDRYLYVV